MLELRVITGQSKGAAFPILGEKYKIGNSCFNDIIIGEIKDSDFFILRDSGEENRFIIRNEADPEQMAKKIDVDEKFEIDGVSFLISDSGKKWPTPKQENEKIFLSVKNIALLFSVSFIILLVTILILNPQVVKKNDVVEKMVLSTPDETSRVLYQMLSERIDEYRKLTITTKENNVLLSGKVTEEERLKIEKTIGKLNEQYINKIGIENNTKLLSGTLPFRVQQVITYPQKLIVTNDGTMVFVGDTYRNVTLTSIDKDELIFDGEKQIKIKW